MEEAQRYLEASGKDTKLAIMMCLSGLGREEAKTRWMAAGGFLRNALVQDWHQMQGLADE